MGFVNDTLESIRSMQIHNVLSQIISLGVKDGAKLLLLEKPAPVMEQKAEPVFMDESMMKACEAVARVRAEVDKLSAKVKMHALQVVKLQSDGF